MEEPEEGLFLTYARRGSLNTGCPLRNAGVYQEAGTVKRRFGFLEKRTLTPPRASCHVRGG